MSGYSETRAITEEHVATASRLVGENPCNVDKIFRKIKQFRFHGRRSGGVSGVEMALMDLAGKAYGVPAYALIGGRFRDEIRCYADTPSLPDPHAIGARLLDRKQRGFTVHREGRRPPSVLCGRRPLRRRLRHRARRRPRRPHRPRLLHSDRRLTAAVAVPT